MCAMGRAEETLSSGREGLEDMAAVSSSSTLPRVSLVPRLKPFSAGHLLSRSRLLVTSLELTLEPDTPSNVRMTLLADIATIRSWSNKQPHFPEDIDDHLIERFISCCDGSLEKTKATMDRFFCYRADAPEFFTDRDPLQPRMQEVFRLIDLLPLPHLTPEGYKVFIYKVADPDPEKFNFIDYVKNFFLVGDTRVKTESVIPKGEVVIFDMRGYTLSHLLRLPLLALRKYMQYTQEAHPVKLRQIHVINVSPLLDKTMVLVRPFMKSEVAAMLHFHQPDSTTLYDFVPQELLPREYGGKAGSTADIKETWKARVEKNRDWLMTNPWLANNSKRTDKKNQLNFMEGSFRTLTID